MLTSSWTLAMLGAASWILARLMWDRPAVEQPRGLLFKLVSAVGRGS